MPITVVVIQCLPLKDGLIACIIPFQQLQFSVAASASLVFFPVLLWCHLSNVGGVDYDFCNPAHILEPFFSSLLHFRVVWPKNPSLSDFTCTRNAIAWHRYSFFFRDQPDHFTLRDHLYGTSALCSVPIHVTVFCWYSSHLLMEGWPGWVDLAQVHSWLSADGHLSNY